jgi:hypothetical protein
LVQGVAIQPDFPKSIDIGVVQPEDRIECCQVRIGHPPSRGRTNLPVDGIMRRQFQRSGQVAKMN